MPHYGELHGVPDDVRAWAEKNYPYAMSWPAGSEGAAELAKNNPNLANIMQAADKVFGKDGYKISQGAIGEERDLSKQPVIIDASRDGVDYQVRVKPETGKVDVVLSSGKDSFGSWPPAKSLNGNGPDPVMNALDDKAGFIGAKFGNALSSPELQPRSSLSPQP